MNKTPTIEKSEIIDKYKLFLSNHGLKFTKQRDLIFSTFIELGGHISADQLFKVVQNVDSSIGLASIYRTLKSIVDAGLAQERTFLNKTALYELSEETEHHDHLVCTKCSKVLEFENKQIESLQEKVAQELGFTLDDHYLVLYGKCADCR